MTNTENSRRKSLTTMVAALLAGSLVATAGGFAYAKTDGQAFDPAKFQQRIEKRVDKALTGTDATPDQKKKVDGHPQGRVQRHEAAARPAGREPQGDGGRDADPAIDPARIEQIRAEQMKVADQSSKRFTKALTDAGNVLSASQRQAFFKNWSQAAARIMASATASRGG